MCNRGGFSVQTNTRVAKFSVQPTDESVTAVESVELSFSRSRTAPRGGHDTQHFFVFLVTINVDAAVRVQHILGLLKVKPRKNPNHGARPNTCFSGSGTGFLGTDHVLGTDHGKEIISKSNECEDSQGERPSASLQDHESK